MKIEEFIYKDSVDAFSYLGVFLLSVVIPTAISLATDNILLLLLAIFINSIGLMREYILLVKCKKVGKRFWVERLIGIALSVIIALYSVVALLFIANEFGQAVFNALNVICSILFLYPGVIASIEGILYIKQDYGNNVVATPIPMVEDTAADV